MAKSKEAATANMETPAVNVEAAAVESLFSKEQLIASKRYQHRRDALSVVLRDGEFYSLEQADKLLDDFMKER